MKMKQEIINTIPFEIVEKYASYNSDFVEFLCMEFGADVAKRIVDDYALGNIDGKTILWNIGTHGEVYGGQVIGYNRQGYIRNDWRDNLITVNPHLMLMVCYLDGTVKKKVCTMTLSLLIIFRLAMLMSDLWLHLLFSDFT
jgi:hypothetical protein